MDPRDRDILRRDLRGGAPRRRRGRIGGGPRHPVAGRSPGLRRRGARAGQPGPRPHHRLGGRSRAGRRRHRPLAARRRGRHRRARSGRRAAGGRHLRQDPRVQPRPSAPRREPSRRPPFRAVARGPRPRAAVRRAAGERGAHHAARRSGLGRVPPAGPDPGRRRRRGIRQGGQAARPGVPGRAGHRAAGEGRTTRPLHVPPADAPGAGPRRPQPVRLLLQRAQDRGAAGSAAAPPTRPEPRPPSRTGPTWPAAFRTRPSTCSSPRPATRWRSWATAPP